MRFFNSLCLVVLCWTTLSAQNIGMETAAPIFSAKVDGAAKKQQRLIPRVTLAAVTDGTTPINRPTIGVLVYNLNKNIIGGTGVGLYYWAGKQWTKLVAETEGNWVRAEEETGLQTKLGESKALGTYALAIGLKNSAQGASSVAMGHKSLAYSYGEMVVGTYNTTYVPVSESTWKALDRVFVVGNGNSDTMRSNALTVYKNGIININDAYELPNVDGMAGQVLMTNGRGQTAWQAVLSDKNKTILPSFTPLNTADVRGKVGEMTWDEHYIYVKTTKGWKRMNLTPF